MIYIHGGENQASKELLFSCDKQGVKSKVIDLENVGSLSEVVNSGCGPIIFRPTLHETNFNLCIRKLGVLNELGFPILPSWRAILSYDDKVLQYQQLIDSGLPHCDTRVVSSADLIDSVADLFGYPLVVKLRSGAASSNVRLMRCSKDLHRYAKKMFSVGASPVPSLTTDFQTNIRKSSEGILAFLKKAPLVIARRIKMKLLSPRERGYVLIQRFYPENTGDIRVTIIKDRAFVLLRKNRPNDFRASGSGLITYPDCGGFKAEIELAFRLTDYLQAKYLAVDMIKDNNGSPIIVEYCPGFARGLVEKAPGFMCRDGEYVSGSFKPSDLIIQDVIDQMKG